ncbi:hypothetical protein C8E87_1323 [Paractinoplanes brasiliensis]|uniref:Clumping factor A n=1 Tax=Paractinoplanes brasiliensis TaxID=52695 RepID=A0A4R6JMX1_9ACTN|nr:hypothetical protein [Actinoplanes brasiliensis]TDO37690.1 hypothetical protein C8E87_1323 [Actinoplanes brasiliensis]GID31739.1 hypothetical protein Abr02nite_67220 [Actinoplanes brasiliensis]
MIVVSLLLILVAVTLLVLGLTGGSSSLLISSIVASLVAAVLLVIGARQAAAARRATPAAPEEPAAPADENSVFVAEPEFAAAAEQAAARRLAPEDAAPDDRRDTVQFDPGDVAAARPSAGPDFAAASESPAAYADQAGAVPAGDLSADGARRRDLGPDERGAEASRRDEDPAAPEYDSAAASGYDNAAGPGRDRTSGYESAPAAPEHGRGADAPDYERASDAINAARNDMPEEDAWGRRPAGAAAGTGVPVTAPEAAQFAEPDADDPDDEPLPQAVQPADAVRVARLDAEVLVVDGRPRYHVAECPSLAGRLAEPIPVSEAVELGFSPCGLCRPVDRLVAAAARH